MFYFLSIDLVSISPPTTDERKTQPRNDARRGARRRAHNNKKNNRTCYEYSYAFIYNKNAPNDEAHIPVRFGVSKTWSLGRVSAPALSYSLVPC